MMGSIPVSAQNETVTASPACGRPGDAFQLTGSGWAAPGTVAFTFDKIQLTSAPVHSDGIYAVVATQSYLGAALAIPPLIMRAEFTIPCVKGSIKLIPRVGPPGTVVTVIGTGFPVGAIVKLSWDRGITFKVASITVDASQGFQVKLLIYPHDQLGKRRLGAGPDLSVANAIIFNIATADFLVVPGSEQPRDFSWRR